MPKSEAFRMDCMEYMRGLPDKAFDLAVVDPPYGDGLHAEDGGGKGWFTKYNQSAKNYAGGGVSVNVSTNTRERPRIGRTGGTWAEKYAKKS